MWPFDAAKGGRGPPADDEDGPPPALLDRVTRLEREFLALQTEWADTLDKIGRHFARSAARDRQRLHRDLTALENPSQDAPGDTISPEGISHPAPDAKARLRALVNQRRLQRGA